jgi:S-adenosylmethionine:tRNA ribosyltransferase-isomerase
MSVDRRSGRISRVTFAAPALRTAAAPTEHRGLRRDDVRLLVAAPDGLHHRRFRDLPGHLAAGDLLVVNNSATLAAELDGTSSAHGSVVVHVGTRLERPGPESRDRVIELRTAPDAARPILDATAGETIDTPAGVTLWLLAPYPRGRSSPTGVGNRLWRARVSGTDHLEEHLAQHGRPIAYGYLADQFPLADYQTVFALRPGSAEMPSAARPFTPELVTRLVAAGVGVAPITLHTGLSSQDAGEHPQPEWFEVPPATARMCTAVRAGGGRVVAVGTTVVRALASASDPAGVVHAGSGWTDLVVTADRPVRVVDGLITGWHDPHASHLMLVESVAGSELAQAAYDAAVAGHYLWHEFGDSSLLLRR